MNETYVKFGALLKLERERRGVKLELIASELKIPIETLQQIEAGQSEALPSELYFRLFCKSYAEFLGIDFTKTIEAIHEELGESLEPTALETAGVKDAKKTPEPIPATAVIEPLPERKRGRGLLVAIVVVGVLVICVGAYFVFFRGGSPKQSNTEVMSNPDYSTAVVPDTRRGWDTSGARPADSMVLTLTARVGSWATVLSDGDTMLYQMLTPGRPYNVTAKEQFVVTIGNPLVVDVLLNGLPAQLADPETGEASQVEIDMSTAELFLVPADSLDSLKSQAPGQGQPKTSTGGVTPGVGRTGGR